MSRVAIIYEADLHQPRLDTAARPRENSSRGSRPATMAPRVGRGQFKLSTTTGNRYQMTPRNARRMICGQKPFSAAMATGVGAHLAQLCAVRPVTPNLGGQNP